ncbi:hypothetical protein B0I72DRAFT_143796 [Yarrowia lipolytica]|uniref:YALI0B23452p n=3 Tax=Yarrowia lipolytica TaxID=4952 RepID=Q6CDJ5_YARLI|nr:YALI0B23452p [Yarrowia lipolytica CLIB122]KAB8283510.1 hypothetical protein BKA91DRAFT_83209 [Yarrowia lipolytica]KAE8173257.1 hypothetical protein BKA90DRAFT_145798 [Yarrowia lipolytica]KAJ8052884.1 hypothetical protein LXG23DRAFT_52361 [Yarrowia lipolytica]QNP96954.1 Hypothetical protein YALI2_C00607g [Yarrowia lipolytica]RDW24326.1 hypothetical protein B0I71DRAFT_154407 [Yarrowia lipolytica]|eukprot:XP_501267.1 YALI0B23452p [Yarrowia lipolytica CLIB122]
MDFLLLEATHRLKTQFNPVDIKLNRTQYDSRDEIVGSFTVHRLTPRLLSSIEFNESLIEFYLIGTHQYKKQKKEVIKEKIKFTYTSTSTDYLHYSFVHNLNVKAPTLYNGDAMVSYKLALEVKDRAKDPRLSCFYPIKVDLTTSESDLDPQDLASRKFQFSLYSLKVHPITKENSYFELTSLTCPGPVVKTVSYKLYAVTNGSRQRISKGEVELRKPLSDMKIPIHLKSMPPASFETELISHTFFLEVKIKGQSKDSSSKVSVPVDVFAIKSDPSPPPYAL